MQPRSLALPLSILAGLLLMPAAGWRPVLAQTPDWRESETESFVIVYPPSAGPARDYYAARADGIYRSMAAAFGRQIERPLTLRLYAEDEAYLAANPLFVELGGVLAQARRGRREVAISLPRALEGQALASLAGPERGQPGLDNALRLELAQLYLGVLSEDRLPAGFRNGVARYMQQPTDALSQGVARLREARDADRLIDWSALNGPGAEYLDPPLAQPQSLSIVHYLVERQGFARLVRFVEASAESAGWREALEATYGARPSELVDAWEAWLPQYLDGAWRSHALYSADLGPAERLMRRGDFEGAIAQLASAISILDDMDPQAAAAARARLAEAEAGLTARAQGGRAAAALQGGRYAEALQLAGDARSVLTRLGDAAGADYAAALAERAREGAEAEAQLRRAESLPPWRAAEARLAGYEAMLKFSRIGNEAAAARAREHVARLDRRQAPVGWALLAAGVAVIGWSLRQRRRDPALGRA